MFKELSVPDAAQLITQKDTLVIDIRDLKTFNQGHIQGAEYVDNSNINDFIKQADKSKALIVCCYRGHASQGAAQFLSEQGFDRCFSLTGGMCEWVLTKPVTT